MCVTAVFALQRKKLGCVKTLQNFCKICLFSLQNFAFWMQNLRLFFAKNRGDSTMVERDERVQLRICDWKENSGPPDSCLMKKQERYFTNV